MSEKNEASWDVVGCVFGEWNVLEVIPPNCMSKRTTWKCKCSCGVIKVLDPYTLKRGQSKSCGCTHKTALGMWGTRTYNSYRGMLSRCLNPDHNRYSRYGGRGIKVCERWVENFSNFLQDMGECPEGMSIGRVDNDRDYEPSNCRWETNQEQAENRSNNRRITYKGETKTLSAWAKEIGIDYFTLRSRLDRGWTIERAITETLVSPHRAIMGTNKATECVLVFRSVKDTEKDGFTTSCVERCLSGRRKHHKGYTWEYIS